MNIESHNTKTKYKAEFIAGFVLAMCLSLGCISQFHSPWDCKQAKGNWQKKQVNHSNQSSQQFKQVMVDRDTIHVCF